MSVRKGAPSLKRRRAIGGSQGVTTLKQYCVRKKIALAPVESQNESSVNEAEYATIEYRIKQNAQSIIAYLIILRNVKRDFY